MSKQTTLICNIEHYAVHDGAGIRTLIFFKGCPLCCRWCANPESQSLTQEYFFDEQKCLNCGRCKKDPTANCPVNARTLVAQEMTVDEVMQEILKDQIFYQTSNGGVTLSGGEVLLQTSFAAKLLKTCLENNIHTAIETCGFAPWENLQKIAPLCNQILYDIKTLDPQKHLFWTGAGNQSIIENLQNLAKIHQNIIIRVPLIPTINAFEAEITAICDLANKLEIKEIHLLPYHTLAKHKYQLLNKTYSMPDLPILHQDELSFFESIILKHNLKCYLNG